MILGSNELFERSLRVARSLKLLYKLRFDSVIAGANDIVDRKTSESPRFHRPDELCIDAVILHPHNLIQRKTGISQVANLFNKFGANAMIVGADDLRNRKILIACGLKRADKLRCDAVTRNFRELIGWQVLVSKIAELFDKRGVHSM